MPLDERNVPLPPDNARMGKTSWRLLRETAGCRGDSPVTSRSLRAGYISRSAI
jgi:hypothetical protein